MVTSDKGTAVGVAVGADVAVGAGVSVAVGGTGVAVGAAVGAIVATTIGAGAGGASPSSAEGPQAATTANAAAVQVLQALAGRPRAAIFEATDAAERRPLPGIADSLPQWLHRGKSPQPPGKTLEETVRRLQFPAGRVYVWMALESGAMRRIRRYLMDDAGLPPEQMITRGYWKLGAADHPDGDYGDP